MKSALCSILLLSLVAASPLKMREAAPGVISFPIEGRTPKERFLEHRLRKRDSNSTSMVLYNNINSGAYITNITLGTPGQSVRVQVDTGSSDLWVQSADNSACTDSQTFCALTKTFDAESSSTFDVVSDDFKITYADGTYAAGEYVKDTLEFNGVTLTDFTFGLAVNSTSSLGVLGIGYAANEVASSEYENLPELLVSEGIIDVKAYSLWLNDLEASTGNLLFGGIDLGKFTGDLVTVDINPTTGNTYAQFLVSITDIVVNSKTNSTTVLESGSINVVLDSGTTYGVLPSRVVADIVDALGSGTYADDYGLYIVDCDLENSSETVNITFNSKASLSVGLDQLVVPLEYNSEGNTLCALGVQPYSSEDSSLSLSSATYLLGDAFLRSGYFVYDLDNNQVSVAQAVFNSDKSDIVTLNSTGVSGQSGSGVSSKSAGAGLRSCLLTVGAATLLSIVLIA